MQTLSLKQNLKILFLKKKICTKKEAGLFYLSFSELPTQVSHHQGVVDVVHHRPGHSYGGLHPA